MSPSESTKGGGGGGGRGLIMKEQVPAQRVAGKIAEPKRDHAPKLQKPSARSIGAEIAVFGLILGVPVASGDCGVHGERSVGQAVLVCLLAAAAAAAPGPS